MRLFLLVTVALSLTAFGQKEGKHTCRVLFLDAPKDAPKEMFLFDGKKSQEVALPRMNLSPVYDLPGGDLTLVLSEKSIETIEEVNPKAPSVRVPAQVKDFYLLVASDRTNPVTPVKLQVIQVRDNEFKNGEMLWFNVTPKAIGGKVGSEKLVMKPNSKALVKKPAPKKGTYDVELVYQIKGDKKIYPLTETVWNYDPRSRMVVFVTEDEGRRTPRVRGFSDFREKPKEEGEEG